MNIKTLVKYFKLINRKLNPSFILHQNSNVLLFPKSKLHIEIQSDKFPLDKKKNLKKYIFSHLCFKGGLVGIENICLRKNKLPKFWH